VIELKQIIAVEGIVHAGKTTLIRHLERVCDKTKFQFIKEYGDFIVGGQNFPGFPKNQIEALSSNGFFEKLEQKRFETIRQISQVVILDRSLLSVLAYHYATEKITQEKIKCFNDSLNYFLDNFSSWIPQVCLYLKITVSEMYKRHEGDGFYESILLCKSFNAYLLSFYDQMSRFFPNMTIYEIEAHKTKKEVLNNVLNEIKK